VILNYKLGILSSNNSKMEHLDCVTVARSVCIPAFAEAIIAVKNSTRFNNMTALLEPLLVFQFRTIRQSIMALVNTKIYTTYE